MSSTSHTNDTRTVTEKLRSFLQSYYRDELGTLLERYPDDQRSLEIDYQDLFRHDSDLAADYLRNPEPMREYAEEALRTLDLPVDMSLGHAHVRVTNLPDSERYSVGDYRTDQQGDYVALSGQVARRTGVKPKSTELCYECQRCGTLTRLEITSNELREPHECQGCERNGPFEINEDQSEFVDFQVLRLQRPPEESTGGHSATIDVELEEDITGEVEPGDRLDAAGTLKMRPTSDDDATFDYYLDSDAIDPKETSYEDIEIQPHLEDIKELADENPFEQLVDAIAQKVYGYDHIKESIILQLFGGVRAEYPDGSADRGSIHVLLLGDPGVAKSKLLRAADQLAPRSTFASGKGTSAAGLTAGVVSDDFGGERYSLKAGALVTANDGVACIDELDKVDEETRSSLHTALEQQVVEVNKIMEASMPARTSLLAAGNPKYGRFDTHEAIAEQITLGPALLSRFDLMFMLQDEVEQEHDEEVADHIIDSNQEAIKATHGNEDSDSGLIHPDVDADLLRAYIAYARQRVHPTIEDQDVKRELRDNFVALRGMGEDADAPIPVTFRKLEAVLRLAQASARVRLSNTIESVDVQRAQDLIGQSLRDIEMDPDTGQFDADMVETGTPKSQRDRKKRMLSIIDDLAAEHEKGADIETVIERAEEMDIGPSTAEHDIDDLLNKGQVYSPLDGYLRPT
jgi:replicative DNA helicase Mcm